ncbi:MAG: putative peptidoglycan glycosyltransferase FtsW [candidate division Zixibacteria bacterium]|nr:putative peptidoglycan glycosyltransferase FtsW [candidate division Zixibacteria bacterium]
MKKSPAETRFDEGLLIAYLGVLIIGIVMVYSSSSIIAESRYGSHLYFFKSQFVWALMSLGAIFLILKLDLQRLAIYSVPALLLTMIALLAVFVMPARNEAQRWLMLGPLTVQPSEFFKFLLIVFLAFSLSNPKRNIADVRQLIMPYAPIIGVGLGLILLQPNLGTVLVAGITALGIFFLAGARIRHLLTAGLPLVGTALLVIFVIGYKKARVMSHLAAVSDPLTGSYQVKQSALTLGAGGLMGTGLGEGTQKLWFLPYPYTDFIFAAAGQEIGFVGLLVVLGALLYIYRGCKIAAGQPDKFGFLLAAGLTWSLFVNIAINIGMVTAILPVTGIALPFISYGGSSLLVSSAAIGVLLNLSRRVTVR